jgi:hypothetical protein
MTSQHPRHPRARPARGALLALALAAWGVACTDAFPPVDPDKVTPDNPVESGQTDFATAEPGQGNTARGDGAGGMPAGAPASDSGSPAEGGTNAGAPGGRTGTVEEADLYRFEGNRLYSLNTYRGLVIYDLADPERPRQLSRVPVFGYPTEMFVSGSTVYALFRDVLTLTQQAEGVKFERRNVSQFVAIDVSDAGNPRILKRLDIIGQLREGVSRKVENTVYVVSYFPQSYYYFGYPFGEDRREQAWVYSFDVSNPAEPREVERLRIFEGGSGSTQTPGSSEGRYLQGFALSATANTLHVVENWQTYRSQWGGTGGCGGSSVSEQQAVVSVVDISDPSGDIRLHARFQTLGHLRDQFKHTYVHDPATGKGTYYGIFARQEWSWSGCQSSQVVRNTLEAWDVTDGAAPVKLDALDFGKENETVVGSAFDVSRGVVYAITARQVDPLYTIRISEPRDLKVLSAIDGLSGDMSVFRPIAGGDFLIGIGRDTSAACTGFGPNTGVWSSNVAVSIIDVRDLAATRLVQRKCVALKNAQWAFSEVSWNLDQAHKLIGMSSDGRANVVSVPVSYYRRDEGQDAWWYRYESAVGLMTWDLSRYDPSKSELEQQVLDSRATVVHPAGQVRRSVFFTHQGATPRRMMFNLSDTHLSVVDVEDLSAPVTRAVVEVAPYVQEVFRFGDFLVEHTRPDGNGYGGQSRSEFRVRPVSAPADGAPVAGFTQGQVARVTRWKDLLLVFREWWTPGNGGTPGARSTQLVVYDLANPASPVLRGKKDLPFPVNGYGYGYGWMWCGTEWDRGFGFGAFGGSDQAALETGLVFLERSWDAGAQQPRTRLHALTLTRPEAPEVRSQEVGGGAVLVLGVVADAGDRSRFFLSSRERVGSSTRDGQPLDVFRYAAQAWGPAAGGTLAAQGPRVSLPGQLVRAFRGAGAGDVLLSQDHRFTWTLAPQGGYSYWRAEPRLHLLRVDGSRATLLDTHLFEGEHLGELVADGDRLFVSARPGAGYYYGYGYGAWYPSGGSSVPAGGAVKDYNQRLYAFDLAGSALDVRSRTDLGVAHAQLMGHRAGRLFLTLPGDGVLVLDATDLASPRGQGFLRTLGWTTHLEFTDDTIYAAAGHYGLFSLPLLHGSL